MTLVIIIIWIPEKTEVDEYAQESYIVASKLKAASSHYIAQDKPVSRNRVSQLTCSACFLLLFIYLLEFSCLHQVVYVVLKTVHLPSQRCSELRFAIFTLNILCFEVKTSVWSFLSFMFRCCILGGFVLKGWNIQYDVSLCSLCVLASPPPPSIVTNRSFIRICKIQMLFKNEHKFYLLYFKMIVM